MTVSNNAHDPITASSRVALFSMARRAARRSIGAHLLRADSKPPLVTDRENVRLMRELSDGQGRKAELSTEVEVREDSSRLICRGSFVWKLRRAAPGRHHYPAVTDASCAVVPDVLSSSAA